MTQIAAISQFLFPIGTILVALGFAAFVGHAVMLANGRRAMPGPRPGPGPAAGLGRCRHRLVRPGSVPPQRLPPRTSPAPPPRSVAPLSG